MTIASSSMAGSSPVYPRVYGGTPPGLRMPARVQVYPRVYGGSSAASGRVYPRVYGGTLSRTHGCSWRGETGLSPRVRGNQCC